MKTSWQHLIDHEILRAEFKKRKTCITLDQYDYWKKNILVVDLLKGKTQGDSFCRYFKILDFLLVFGQHEDLDAYIKEHYVR